MSKYTSGLIETREQSLADFQEFKTWLDNISGGYVETAVLKTLDYMCHLWKTVPEGLVDTDIMPVIYDMVKDI